MIKEGVGIVGAEEEEEEEERHDAAFERDPLSEAFWGEPRTFTIEPVFIDQTFKRLFKGVQELRETEMPIEEFGEDTTEEEYEEIITRIDPEIKKIFFRQKMEPDIIREEGFSNIRDEMMQELNERQAVCLVNALKYNFTLIQGPPGTGKTHTLSQLIKALLRET